MDREKLEAKSVLHLQTISTEIICPACYQTGETIVRYEATTMWQRFVETIECCCPCKKWNCVDINHYCNKCGCFIGRFITLDRMQKREFKLRQNNIRRNSF